MGSLGVCQAWEAFFNDRSMWISRAVLVHQLGILSARLEYLVAKHGEKVNSPELDDIMEQLQLHHEEESRRWREIRGWVGTDSAAQPAGHPIGPLKQGL